MSFLNQTHKTGLQLGIVKRYVTEEGQSNGCNSPCEISSQLISKISYIMTRKERISTIKEWALRAYFHQL